MIFITIYLTVLKSKYTLIYWYSDVTYNHHCDQLWLLLLKSLKTRTFSVSELLIFYAFCFFDFVYICMCELENKVHNWWLVWKICKKFIRALTRELSVEKKLQLYPLKRSVCINISSILLRNTICLQQQISKTVKIVISFAGKL